MRTFLMSLTAAALVLAIGLAPAQDRPRQGKGGGGFMQFGGMANQASPLILLTAEKVQKEINLTDDQKNTLQKFREETQSKMREMFQGGNFDKERMQDTMK